MKHSKFMFLLGPIAVAAVVLLDRRMKTIIQKEIDATLLNVYYGFDKYYQTRVRRLNNSKNENEETILLEDPAYKKIH
ncbi:MAG: hypothetical protein IJG59_09835 [Erysipelotrichaceae bacterium]|nr:hypothetical protein [Erysipelotrichaceae bacterium]